jgi:hypothetical protein
MPIRDEQLGLSPEESARKKSLRSLQMPGTEESQTAPEAPEGFSFPENPEKGLEEEGFLDVVKPYKQAAAGSLREAGHPVLAGATELLVPDSPLDFLPNGSSSTVVASGIKSVPVPKGAMGKDLPETQKKMRLLKEELKRMLDSGPPSEEKKEMMAGARELLHKIPETLEREELIGAGTIARYPKKTIDQLLDSGEYQKAIDLHHSFRNEVPQNPIGKAAYERQAQKIMEAVGSGAETQQWAKGL